MCKCTARVFLSVVDHALTVEDLYGKVCRDSTSQYHKVCGLCFAVKHRREFKEGFLQHSYCCSNFSLKNMNSICFSATDLSFLSKRASKLFLGHGILHFLAI